MLIRQVAIECGYSSASLRERSTSARHDTGRRGAAVHRGQRQRGNARRPGRAGPPRYLKRLLDQAFQDALRCSSDPLCAEHVPVDPSAELHAAACHACLFASETSCETNNRWLDRAVLADLTGDGLAFRRDPGAHRRVTTARAGPARSLSISPGGRPAAGPCRCRRAGRVRALRGQARCGCLRGACDQLLTRTVRRGSRIPGGAARGSCPQLTGRASSARAWTSSGPGRSRTAAGRLTAATVIELIGQARREILLVSYATHSEPAIQAALTPRPPAASRLRSSPSGSRTTRVTPRPARRFPACRLCGCIGHLTRSCCSSL